MSEQLDVTRAGCVVMSYFSHLVLIIPGCWSRLVKETGCISGKFRQRCMLSVDRNSQINQTEAAAYFQLPTTPVRTLNSYTCIIFYFEPRTLWTYCSM